MIITNTTGRAKPKSRFLRRRVPPMEDEEEAVPTETSFRGETVTPGVHLRKDV